MEYPDEQQRWRSISLKPNAVPHPGETVLEYLDFYGWSQSDLARRTGLTSKTISEICNAKAPIAPPTALALEKAFQRPAHLWLSLLLHFDEAEERRRELAKSPQWDEWARNFPLKIEQAGRFHAVPVTLTRAKGFGTSNSLGFMGPRVRGHQPRCIILRSGQAC